MYAEFWVWFAIVLCVVMARYVSQWITQSGKRSIRRFRLDDLIMLFATCTYCIAMGTLYEYSWLNDYTNWDGLQSNDEDAYTYYEHKLWTMLMVSETALQTTLWANKACLLLLYKYFTRVSSTDKLFRISVAFLVLTYIAVIVKLYTECIPFEQALIFDPDSEECLTWLTYLALQYACNVSTGLFLLILFWIVIVRARLPLVKKVVLFSLFSLGLFMIAAATLTKVSVFTGLTNLIDWIPWCFREMSMVMIVANLIVCFPMLLMIYRHLRTLMPTEVNDLTHKLGKAEEHPQNKQDAHNEVPSGHIELQSQSSSGV